MDIKQVILLLTHVYNKAECVQKTPLCFDHSIFYMQVLAAAKFEMVKPVNLK